MGGSVGLDRADLGDRDLEIRQRLQKKRLEGFIRSVHLVDQQDRWSASCGSSASSSGRRIR
jgi:hypothetical protein